MACAKEMLDQLDAESAALRAALLTSSTAG
jgi:hypothetical protein